MYIKCKSDIKISDCEAVARVFYEVLKNEDEVDHQKEHFWVMGLTAKNRVLYLELVSLGCLTESEVYKK